MPLGGVNDVVEVVPTWGNHTLTSNGVKQIMLPIDIVTGIHTVPPRRIVKI